MAANNYYYALGRRKRATAQVRLYAKKGDFKVNEKEALAYFDGSKHLQNELMKPFTALELDPADYTISARVAGGGHASQIDAIRLAVAKALVSLNEDYRGSLRRAELLGRDPREKERKKFGFRSARKKRQFTKR
ncbi:MAG TPA: 30S ribosomal protein S9 [Candidatus Saccharimonadales bacterium]|nr:30S ribosomal protein S9 [Candidatus Saccharimonadales bacterium]